MRKMNILLIEDERPLGLAINRILTANGWHVAWMADGETGLQTAREHDFDAIVLDVLLPKKNGWDVCSELRAEKINTPILMLSAMDEPDDKVRGLEMGADDYLAKPFETTELVARVKSLLRRQQAYKGPVMRIADLVIDRRAKRVAKRGQEIDLTSPEYAVLEKLAVNEGRVVSRESLAESVRSGGGVLLSAIEEFVSSLRTKIDAPNGPSIIRNGAASGYAIFGDAKY